MKVVIDVNGQHLSLRSQTSELVQGSRGFIKIYFNFLDPTTDFYEAWDWDKLDKTLYVIEKGKENPIERAILFETKNNRKQHYCFLPTEEDGIYQLCLKGIGTEGGKKQEKVVVATTDILSLKIKPLGDFEDTSTFEGLIDPSIIDGLNQDINELNEDIATAKADIATIKSDIEDKKLVDEDTFNERVNGINALVAVNNFNITQLGNRHDQEVGQLTSRIDNLKEDTKVKIDLLNDRQVIVQDDWLNSNWDTRIAEVQKNILENDGVNFIFCTDLHFGYLSERYYNPSAAGYNPDTDHIVNDGRSAYIIRKIIEETGIDTVFCGGDIVRGGMGNSGLVAPESVRNIVQADFEQFQKWKEIIGVPVFTCRGNHDITISGAENVGLYRVKSPYDNNYIDQTFFQNKERYIVKKSSEGTYFYVDDIIKKYRFIFVDFYENRTDYEGTVNQNYSDNLSEYITNASGQDILLGMSQEQLSWLADVTTNLLDGWKMVIISHDYFIGKGIDILNRKTNNNYFDDFWSNVHNYLSLECILAGHVHTDAVCYSTIDSNKKIPTFETTTDSPSVLNRANLAKTEPWQYYAIDVFSIGSNGIKAVRFGTDICNTTSDSPFNRNSTDDTVELSKRSWLRTFNPTGTNSSNYIRINRSLPA